MNNYKYIESNTVVYSTTTRGVSVELLIVMILKHIFKILFLYVTATSNKNLFARSSIIIEDVKYFYFHLSICGKIYFLIRRISSFRRNSYFANKWKELHTREESKNNNLHKGPIISFAYQFKFFINYRIEEDRSRYIFFVERIR